MRKISVVFWSIAIFIVVCFLELAVCNSLMYDSHHLMMGAYTPIEKCLFLLVILLTCTAVFFVLKSDGIKPLLIKSVIMIATFIILAIIDLRDWIGILTNNETIVLGVNFLGDAIWISHYSGCLMGMIANVILSKRRCSFEN